MPIPRGLQEESPPLVTARTKDEQLSEVPARACHSPGAPPKSQPKIKFCCQASGGSMASQLFSTAVISGSSSVPNLGAGGGACPESESPSDPSAIACLTLCHLVSHDSNHYDSQVIPWVMISVIMPHAPFSSRRSSVAGSPVQSSGNRGSVAFHTAPLGK